MSDFLANLVGRSLGASEVVQPRVPSVYEPYRRGSGLLGAHPNLPARDTDPQPAVEAGSQDDVKAALINYGTLGLRAPAARATTREGQSSEHEADANAAEGFEPLDSSRTARSLSTVRIVARPEQIAATEVPSRHDSTTELSASPIVRPASFQPSLPTAKARTEGTDFIAATPLDTQGDKIEYLRPPVALRAVTKQPGSPEMKSETSSSSLGLRRSAEPRTSAEQPLSPAPGAVRPLTWPSLQAHPSPPVTGAVRPPVTPRPGRAGSPEGLSTSSPPKSGIQVSIGRVEVRAVFPEPPSHRTPPPRSRPTMSLDDYLNRRNRGKR